MLGKIGIPFETRFYVDQQPTRAVVESVVSRLPEGVFDLISYRGTRYRELGLAQRDLSEDEWIDLLAEEYRLWRRPVIVAPKGVQVGHNEEAIRALLSD